MERTDLSKRQIQVMNVLWDAEEPLTVTGILKRDKALILNTVNASIRSLLKKKYIKIANIVYSGTVLARAYEPIVSREDFMGHLLAKLDKTSPEGYMLKMLIEKEEDINELRTWNLLIEKKIQLLEDTGTQ